MNKKGFTFVELLVVAVIIVILVSIALPQYILTLEKARSTEAIVNIVSVKSGLDSYWYEHGFDLTGVTLPVDGSQGTLNINNPNAVIGKLYTYTISSFSGAGIQRAYTITAIRTTATDTYIILWVQKDSRTGQFYRSANLGGPVYSP